MSSGIWEVMGVLPRVSRVTSCPWLMRSRARYTPMNLVPPVEMEFPLYAFPETCRFDRRRRTGEREVCKYCTSLSLHSLFTCLREESSLSLHWREPEVESYVQRPAEYQSFGLIYRAHVLLWKEVAEARDSTLTLTGPCLNVAGLA